MSSFVGRYKNDWQELESLLKQARKSLRKLSPEQRQRLDVLYRRTTVHLARASTLTNDRQLIGYLNGLTAGAHSLIYLPPRRSVLDGAARFVYDGFARVVARNWRQHATSLVITLFGAAIGYWAAMSDPLTAHALWPAGDPRQPGSTPDQLLAVLRSNRDQGSGTKFLFASFLFQHNLKVALLSMATGVLAAVPTVFLLTFNGMLLGVFVAIHARAGITHEMWAWILPHGITEIGAIVLCGGVGMMLGRAIVRPGRYSRKQALLHAGREAALVAAGAALMLVAAAIIESYVRQSHWSTATRLIFAASTGVFWTLYFTWGFLRQRDAGAVVADAASVGKVTSDSTQTLAASATNR
jgi:uncharacterized membrane protein SpoIIM required for sporulation